MGFGKNNQGVIIRAIEDQALGALAADAVIKIETDIALTEDFRLLKMELTAFVEGLTAGEGDGLHIGIADGELSTTEIKECLEAAGPQDRNDHQTMERANRPVWLIGRILAQLPEVAGALKIVFIDRSSSPMMEWTKRWTFSDPEGWELFVYNRGAGALTTGATVRTTSTSYGVWVT